MSRASGSRQTADMQIVLEDPALAEALARSASFGRLSDAEVRSLRRSRRNVPVAAGASALLLLIAASAWSSGLFAPRPDHYETMRGQTLIIALADGSALQLNGATSLDITLGDHERTVELTRGEAFFDVAHQPDRPFTVHAGRSATRVLGTAFNITLAQDEVKLAVYRGKVRFGGSDGGAPNVVVPAGWRSRFGAQGAQAPTRFDAGLLDWRQGWLDTDAMRLRDLVDTLNRRGGPLILTPPPAIADIALSGRFKLDDPAQLLGAIGDAYGFVMVREGKRLRLEPAPAGDAKSSSQ